MAIVATIKYEDHFLITGRGFVVTGHGSGDIVRGMYLEVGNKPFKIVGIKHIKCLCGQHEMASAFLLKGIKNRYLKDMVKGKEYNVLDKC